LRSNTRWKSRPNLISTVTDSVPEDVLEWQNRPLEPMYAVVFFDALRVKTRDEGTVKNKAVYLNSFARLQRRHTIQ
jgi:transposase-like protein